VAPQLVGVVPRFEVGLGGERLGRDLAPGLQFLNGALDAAAVAAAAGFGGGELLVEVAAGDAAGLFVGVIHGGVHQMSTSNRKNQTSC